MPNGSDTLEALVVGGGQAGLAAGYHLRQAGLSFAILEAGSSPGGLWPGYYDSLQLFSPARYSGLPGLPFPGPPDRYPTRDEVVSYLRGYAWEFGLSVLAGKRVLHAERTYRTGYADRAGHGGAGFRVLTDDGAEYRARTVIAATGSFARSHGPRFPDQESFTGTILHAAEYRGPEPFRSKRVVVVGTGNSAVQIAHELSGVADTTLATRAPLGFRPQTIFGKDIEVSEPGGVLGSGRYAAALAAGRFDRRPVFIRFTEGGVVWDGGYEEAVDAVLLATGYRPNLEYLEPLGVLYPDGRPDQRAGVSRAVGGLYFVGQPFQTFFASATLRGVGPDAALVVTRARRFLARSAKASIKATEEPSAVSPPQRGTRTIRHTGPASRPVSRDRRCRVGLPLP